MMKNNDQIVSEAESAWGTFDERCKPPAKVAELSGKEEAALWRDSRFAPLDQPGRIGDLSLRRFLEQPDDEAIRQSGDPALQEKLRRKEARAVAEAFVSGNKEWLPTDENFELLVRHLARKHLGKAALTTEAAEDELSEAGHWTLQNLNAGFRNLMAAGKLAVKPGATKPLSKSEERDVAAAIATDGPETAVVQHLLYSLGGSLPDRNSTPRDLFARYPEAMSQAAKFVWENSRPTFAPSVEWDAFLSARLKTKRAPLTVSSLDAIWAEFLNNNTWDGFVNSNRSSSNRAPSLAPSAHPAPVDPDSLSDDEVARLHSALIFERAQSLKRRPFSI